MLKNKTQIQVFVSGPSDTDSWKSEVERCCANVSRNMGEELGIALNYVDWHNSVIGEYGPRAQEIINKQINNYDIYIGLFYNKIGSPTGKINAKTGLEIISGTIEEFEIAYTNFNKYGKPIINLIFRHSELGKEQTSKKAEQIREVLKFKESQFQNNKWVDVVKSRPEFKELVERILSKRIWDHDANIKELKEKGDIDKKSEIMADYSHYVKKFLEIKITPPDFYIKRDLVSQSQLYTIKSPFSKNYDRLTLEEVIKENKKVVVLGSAGSGKSTELIHLAVKLAKDDSPFIPIFKQLRHYTDANIEEFLPEGWDKVPAEQLVIIFDGLDEIQIQHFNTAIRKIESFTSKYENIRVVLSSRTNFYKIPDSGSNGTISGFEPFLIADLSPIDLNEYLHQKFAIDNELFVEEVFDKNYHDLLSVPFFLNLLAEIYKKGNSLSKNRASIFEQLLKSRIHLDEEKFRSTYELSEKRNDVITRLEKIALSMELLGRNNIQDDDLRKIVKKSSEMELLKYSTAFQKQVENEHIWEFEHRNLQEYIAARAIAQLPFESIVQFVAFEPDFEVLNPSWQNTISFLVSILDRSSMKYQNLINWIIENDQEIVVKFEIDRIDSEIRDHIFQQIFLSYKRKNIWINSNKFNDKDLSQFGQSNESIEFLLKEIKDPINSPIVKLNAIRLLGYFNIPIRFKKLVTDLFVGCIDSTEFNDGGKYTILRALADSKLNTKETIECLLIKLRKKKNQYIRAGLYTIILASNYLNEYIDVFIEGYSIEQENSEERNDSRLYDESWYLREGLKKANSPEAIRKILSFLGTSLVTRYNQSEILKATIENSISAYLVEPAIFNDIKKLLIKNEIRYDSFSWNLILDFFDKTRTRELVFEQIFNEKAELEHSDIILASIADESLLQFIITKYNDHEINNDDLMKFYNGLRWKNKDLVNSFEKLLKHETDFLLDISDPIDYDKLNNDRTQESFNLFFDKEGLKSALLKVFEDLKKEQISFNELFEIEHNDDENIAFSHPKVVFFILIDFARGRDSVSLNMVNNWFSDVANFERYRISEIQNYLSRHKHLVVSPKQKEWIANWCESNYDKVDFRTAITYNKNDSISVNNLAFLMWYFRRRFDIQFPNSILLDMISFDWPNEDLENQWAGIDDILKLLDKKIVKERVIENLSDGIQDQNVLMNHIKYCVEQKIEETYPLILKEITNKDRKTYNRESILDLYFSSTNDNEGLKDIIIKTDIELRWAIVKKLIDSNEIEFCNGYLLGILSSETDKEALLAAQFLIRINNIKGLEFLTNWAINNKNRLNEEIISLDVLFMISSIEALPYLLKLLKLEYDKDIQFDRFNSFTNYVRDSLFKLGLVSDDNFKAVKNTLEDFIEENKGILKNINFLHNFIDNLKKQFYLNKAQSLSINEIISKIELIQ